ncbi:MAG: hypothetical protein N3D19_00050 [Archaeoglobaceae archaeon]|nr:hypothetical protein [Archaeoglobaceae archaeon]
MKKLFVLLIIIFSAEASHVKYSETFESDQWIYDFYSSFIEKFSEEIIKASKGESCRSFSKELETVKAEIGFYGAKGISTNATLAIDPFLSFAVELEDLCKANDVLRSERSSIFRMKKSLSEMKFLVDEIEKIVYYNGTTPLFFNTSDLREALAKLESTLNLYEEYIDEGFELDEGIWVFVSKTEVYLFEEVWIWIYAKNVKPLRLFIDEKVFEARNMSYTFSTYGEHVVYAEGSRGDEILRSNVVKIFVEKIPVYIHLKAYSAFVGKFARVEGFIFDHYGEALSVSIRVNDFELESREGYFSFSIRRDYECSVPIFVFYEGNETHEKAFANTTVHFSRYPTWIKIITEKERFFEWEKVEIYVEASEDLKIDVFINNIKELNFYGRNKNFSLNLKPGTYKIYAYFEGDHLRKASKSNEITVYVEGFNFVPFIVLPLAMLTLIYFTKKIKNSIFKKKYEKIEEVEVKEEELEEKKDLNDKKEIRDVSEVYSEIFKKLVSNYNLSKSLTPRELLAELKGERFAEKLKEITEIHERSAYALETLTEAELEKFFKLAKEFLS